MIWLETRPLRLQVRPDDTGTFCCGSRPHWGLAGLIALIRQGRWRKDEDVVFLHTGGAPALFAYQSALGI